MSYASGVLTGQGLKRDLRQLCGTGRWIPSLIGVALLLVSVPLTHAQTTAQLTGTVQDSTGGVIPGAQVTLADEATGATRMVASRLRAEEAMLDRILGLPPGGVALMGSESELEELIGEWVRG